VDLLAVRSDERIMTGMQKILEELKFDAIDPKTMMKSGSESFDPFYHTSRVLPVLLGPWGILGVHYLGPNMKPYTI
jgi:hypothetical protein